VSAAQSDEPPPAPALAGEQSLRSVLAALAANVTITIARASPPC
jgi:hypothetical protein